MANTLVSVLIPSYNHEKFILETINSIINQTYQNIELIVLDDGSKDLSWQKIQEIKETCEKRFERVYFETKENEGTCTTINKMINLAKGEFIYLIASDDIAKPTAIEKEVEFLTKNPSYALCVGNSEYINTNSNVCYLDKNGEQTTKEHAKFHTFKDYCQKLKNIDLKNEAFGTYSTLYLGNYIPNGYLIRKSIFKKTGLFTPKAPLEDYYIMLQIAKYSKMKYLDEILFSYRLHPNNTIKNIEKCRQMEKTTYCFEQELLQNADFSTMNSDVEITFKNGVFIKKKGIPYIFEKYKYKKYSNSQKKFVTIKKYKLFGIKI